MVRGRGKRRHKNKLVVLIRVKKLKYEELLNGFDYCISKCMVDLGPTDTVKMERKLITDEPVPTIFTD